MTTKEIDGKKYVQIPDWISDTSMHDYNYAYLEQLPPTELLWFMENCLTLLKKKAVKIEIDQPSTAAANAIEQ